VSTASNKKSGIIRRGSPRHATIRDLAGAAGVSETTVSLAFQPNSRISRETRERILAVGDKLHYIPNLNARTLRMGKSHAIGFLVNDITNPFYAQMVRTAELMTQNRGYQVIFADGHWDPAREVQAVESMIRSRVQGVLLCLCEKTHRTIELLMRYSIPSVVIDTAPEGYTGALVGNDLVAAGELAARHLMDVGCRRVALLMADRHMVSFSAFQHIKEGFLGGLAKRKMNLDNVLAINAGLTIDQGRYGLELLLKRAKNIDGIFCMNDLSAIGVIEAADARKIRVGRELAVIGIDDLEISGPSRISLTTIRQPYKRIVECAVNALIDSIESDDLPGTRLLLEPELIVRNSTRRGP
jgi:LacI family transcriptional regulator